MRGMVTSSTARSTSVESASATASAPSPACATTSRSGAESSTSRSPSRTTSWSSASRMRVFSGTVIARCWSRGILSRTSVPRRGIDSIEKRPPTRIARSRMPAMPGRALGQLARHAVAVVAHAQRDRLGVALRARG